MKKNLEILDLINKDFETLYNLRKSINHALHCNRSIEYKKKIMYSAFDRTEKIMENRRKRVMKLMKITWKDIVQSIKSPLDY